MVIGNYLPKVKQNNTIGIRVVWSLMDEENWNATHRFSGKLWMASGILCMLCGLFGGKHGCTGCVYYKHYGSCNH
ncbi:MAG: SdpI family protein [Gallintestinimicrobium sp.]